MLADRAVAYADEGRSSEDIVIASTGAGIDSRGSSFGTVAACVIWMVGEAGLNTRAFVSCNDLCRKGEEEQDRFDKAAGHLVSGCSSV